MTTNLFYITVPSILIIIFITHIIIGRLIIKSNRNNRMMHNNIDGEKALKELDILIDISIWIVKNNLIAESIDRILPRLSEVTAINGMNIQYDNEGNEYVENTATTETSIDEDQSELSDDIDIDTTTDEFEESVISCTNEVVERMSSDLKYRVSTIISEEHIEEYVMSKIMLIMTEVSLTIDKKIKSVNI
ncbi:hypothetical protein FPHOBKDP_00005 [Listeria phage LPJP1]|nr:hypothetical protein FPHOBKDP_00005 [Listeria phage LPJP1]